MYMIVERWQARWGRSKNFLLCGWLVMWCDTMLWLMIHVRDSWCSLVHSLGEYKGIIAWRQENREVDIVWWLLSLLETVIYYPYLRVYVAQIDVDLSSLVFGFLLESNRQPRDWQSRALTNWASFTSSSIKRGSCEEGQGRVWPDLMSWSAGMMIWALLPSTYFRCLTRLLGEFLRRRRNATLDNVTEDIWNRISIVERSDHVDVSLQEPRSGNTDTVPRGRKALEF